MLTRLTLFQYSLARTRFVAGVTATVLTFAPGVPGPLRSLAFEPYITLVNIMACRVYRRTRAGRNLRARDINGGAEYIPHRVRRGIRLQSREQTTTRRQQWLRH